MCGGHRPFPPPLSLHPAGEAFPEFDCSFCSASPPERYLFLFRHAFFLLALSLAVSLSGWPACGVGVESAHPLQCRVCPCHSSDPVPSSLWVPALLFHFFSFSVVERAYPLSLVPVTRSIGLRLKLRLVAVVKCSPWTASDLVRLRAPRLATSRWSHLLPLLPRVCRCRSRALVVELLQVRFRCFLRLQRLPLLLFRLLSTAPRLRAGWRG